VPIAAPWTGTTQIATSGATSVTLDFTGAATGEWCFAVIGLSDAQASLPTAPSGWTITKQGAEGTTGANSSCLTVYQRRKQAGDTTQAFTWGTACGFAAAPVSWPGLDPATPLEGAVYLAHSSGTTYPTTSITPTAADRWIAGFFYNRTSTSTGTWTPDAAMTERLDFVSAANPWSIIEAADTNAAVTQAAHTYTATSTVTSSHGGSVAFAMIPAAAAAGATPAPLVVPQAAVMQAANW
jgi:hypothetical protein